MAAPSRRGEPRAREAIAADRAAAGTTSLRTWWQGDDPDGSTQFAILPAGTPLYSLPDPSTRSWPLPALDPVTEHWRLPGPPRGIVVEVLGERDGMLEVRTGIDRSRGVHCEADLGDVTELDSISLHLWVPREAPSWVTTRTVRHVADDGSAVILPPGVPLRRSDRDPRDPLGKAWIAAALGVHVELELPRDAIGRRYTRPATPSAPRPARYLPPEASLTFDGEPIAGRTLLSGQGRSIYGDRFDAQGRLVTVGNACITIEARTDRRGRARPPTLAERRALASPATSFRPVRAASTETITVTGYGARLARPGTIVYWKDGRVAGHMTSLHEIEPGAEPSGTNLCFARALGASTPPMSLCMRSEDLVSHSQLEPPWARRVHVGEDDATRLPTVRAATLRIAGDLEEHETRLRIEGYLGQARLCYLPRLAFDATIHGRIDLRMQVDGMGLVTATNADENTTGDDALGDCIAAVAGAWNLPAPLGGSPAAVVVPLMLAAP